MTAPHIVEAWPDFLGGWTEIDGAAWITSNVFDGAAPGEVRIAHNDPATGRQCRDSTGSIGKHTIESVAPLTISPSLACAACSWHGWIRDGKWVPA
jgi:hypothetical protein